MGYTSTPFKNLTRGMRVKYPARGNLSKKGKIVDRQSDKDNVSILVEWDEGGVSSAMEPNDFEIPAKESTDE